MFYIRLEGSSDVRPYYWSRDHLNSRCHWSRVPANSLLFATVDEAVVEAETKLPKRDDYVVCEQNICLPLKAGPARSLYDQTEPVARDAAAALCGMDRTSPAFLNCLRRLPPLSKGFTVGDVARAYLTEVLAELTEVRKARGATETALNPGSFHHY